MKVLMVVIEPKGSGIFQYACLLASALSRVINVSMIVPSDADAPQFDGGYKLIRLPLGDTKKNFIRNTINVSGLMRFLKVVSEVQPDVIHFRNPYVIWPTPCLPLLRRRYGVISGLPDGCLLPGQARLDRVLARSVHIRYSHCLTVESEYDRLILEKTGVKKPCFVIPHGVNTLYLKFAKQDVEDAVLFFGSVDGEYKGVEYLLKAAPLLSKKLPEAKVVIAGSGNMGRFAPLMKACNNVSVINKFIPHAEVYRFFQRAKVVVLPYIRRVNSGVVPLAFAFDKPVVVTDMLGDMVEDGVTGLVVSSRNPEALADALVKLLEDDMLRAQIVKNVRHHVESRMSWNQIAIRALEAYEVAANIASRAR